MANQKKMTKATAWGIVKGIVEKSGHAQTAELVESGAVVRTEDKRKAYFTKVG